jgi:hypothetical protein
MRFAITSVRYADFLEASLPAWLAFLPAESLFVATSREDDETRRVAADHGVACVSTDAWTRRDPSCHQGGDPTFNLAYGLDTALGLDPAGVMPAPVPGEIVGHASADCVPFGTWPSEAAFDADTVYAFWRYECLTPKALAEHQTGLRPLSRFPRLKNTGGAPIGYCQIFRATPGRRFGSWPTAGTFDTQFTKRFARSQMLPDAYFLHLGPISVRANWGGRVVPKWGAA